MSNFNTACPSGNTMVDVKEPKAKLEYYCTDCMGTGRYQIETLVELFDKLEATKYSRAKRGLMPLSFCTWLKMARDMYKNGVECGTCCGTGVV